MSSREVAENPFWVLELTPDATRMDARRAADRILGLLAVSAVAARTYRTPFGPRPRDEALVRRALAALDDAELRIIDELWSRTRPLGPTPAAAPAWDGAFASIGWGTPCKHRSS